MDFIHIQNIGVIQQGAHQRVFGAGGDKHCQPDHRGYRRFLDSQPAGVQLQQADTTGQAHTDQAQQGNEVLLLVPDEFEQAPA